MRKPDKEYVDEGIVNRMKAQVKSVFNCLKKKSSIMFLTTFGESKSELYYVEIICLFDTPTSRFAFLDLPLFIKSLLLATVTYLVPMHHDPTYMTILIAEDDTDDRLFMDRALRQSGYTHSLEFVEDGEELMDYLRREGRFTEQNAPWPDLLILDLNMPRKNGFQALSEIKDDPKLRRLPVVVMTTSSAEEDVVKTYNLGVNSYVTKPFNFNRLVEMVSALKTYWMDTVKLP